MSDSIELTMRYNDAVQSFTDKIKNDPNVIAVILFGSLSHDRVWKKSDIDLHVIVRDQSLTQRSFAIDEDDIVLNVDISTRTDFVKTSGGVRGGSIWQSFMAKGKFVYTTDPSLEVMLEEMREVGEQDQALAFLSAASELIGTMEKIEKWITVKEDPLYAQFYITKAADQMANMALILRGEIVIREAVLRITELIPDFINRFYQVPLSRYLSREEVFETLENMNSFLNENLGMLSMPVIEFMKDGELRTVSQLCRHFGMWSHGITHIFDYLSEKGVVEKVSETVRITPNSKKSAEEIAYLYIPDNK